jgi:hypothetical protein
MPTTTIQLTEAQARRLRQAYEYYQSGRTTALLGFLTAPILNPILARVPGRCVGSCIEWDTDTNKLTVEYEPYEPEPRRCPECGAELED